MGDTVTPRTKHKTKVTYARGWKKQHYVDECDKLGTELARAKERISELLMKIVDLKAPQYEYHVLNTLAKGVPLKIVAPNDDYPTQLANGLNIHSLGGWELVTVVGTYFIFRRVLDMKKRVRDLKRKGINRCNADTLLGTVSGTPASVPPKRTSKSRSTSVRSARSK